MTKSFFVLFLSLHFLALSAQVATTTPVRAKLVGYNVALAFGYVDEGAFLNFTGPGCNFIYGNSKLLLSMLPSLRLKDDRSGVSNTFVTPSLGVGLSYVYRSLLIQLPLYYNPKTSSAHGSWQIGLGIGLMLSHK